MNSEMEYKCIFCKDTFSDKETLQIHFRKHADPAFNSNSKQKVGNTSETSTEKLSKDSPELVSCDVCTESFPTISKAITHKHKMHPEHTAKYFCPWCGKLFTMKHLYNKHMQSTHDTMVKSDEVFFHCDCCDVDFYVPSAMHNHNKFFHRQEADSHDLGQSKKLKAYDQQTYLLYYCSFCGEEYNNKVNLQKHNEDDHADEDNSFTEVLRCPMCDAVFYHLDAYELHLSYHSIDDVYSDELHPDYSVLTEFSLETVPPFMEKIENDTMGVDNFLELALADSLNNEDTGESSERIKTKKRKKHKKSKKEAITLDEFLNMNNIFGEGIDIQGIEEVPKQVITKQLKKRPKASNLNTPSSTDLQKLREQGITIKKKSNNVPMQRPQVMKHPPKVIKPPNKGNPIKTSNDALNKIMNQTNNQIRIVKKPTQENKEKLASPVDDNQSSPKDAHESDHNVENVSTLETSQLDVETDQPLQKDGVLIPTSELMTKVNISKSINDLSTSEKPPDVSNVKENPNIAKSLGLEKTLNPFSSLKNLSSNITIKSVNQQKELLVSNSSDGIIFKNCLPNNAEHLSGVSNACGVSNAQNSISSETTNKTLSALKHLSHLITVKSVNQNSHNGLLLQNEAQICKKVKDAKIDSQTELTKESSDNEDYLGNNVTIATAQTENEQKEGPRTPLDGLKNISKNITIKSLTNVSNLPICSSPNVQMSVSAVNEEIDNNVEDEQVDYDQILSESNAKKYSKEKDNHHNTTNNSSKTSENLSPSTECEGQQLSNNVEDISKNINEDILKRLTNITAKPVTVTNHSKHVKSSSSISGSTTKNIVKNSVASYKMTDEIFSIDDSDSDDIDDALKNKSNNKTTKKDVQIHNQQIEKHSKDIFKTINKNISVKPIEQVKIERSLNDEDINTLPDNSTEDLADNDGDIVNISKNIKSQSNTVLNNVLMNISKNITIKSRNTSPNLSKKCNVEHMQNINLSMNDDGGDFESSPGKVQITEVNDENGSEDQQQSNAVIENPDDTNSDKNIHSDHEQDLNDFDCDDMPESLMTGTRLNNQSTKSVDISQFKNLSKNITIKSVSQSKVENNEIKNATSTLPIINKNSNKQFVLKNESMTGQSVNDSTINQQGSSQMNTVNKQVKVQTYESETIIEEITTTVTKTIRKVNQTVQQQNISQISSSPVRCQKVQNMPIRLPGPIIQGGVRQIGPNFGPKIRSCSPSIRSPVGATVRPSNQLVPVRPRMNLTANNTRMPMVRKPTPPTPNQQKPLANKPLRISPQVKLNRPQKRPITTEETPGPFSCFKKPKESSLSEFSNLGNYQGENVVQYASTSQMSNFSSSKQVMKGNSLVNSTQTKSVMSASSQQLSRLSNMSGLKVMKSSQCKEVTQMEEKAEVCASKRSALEAIEKLQRQGLLVKKPCTDYNEYSEHSNSDIDE